MRAIHEAPLAPSERIDPARYVIVRLEEAGKTLLSLPNSGYALGMRCGMPEVVRNFWEAYNQETAGQVVMKPPRPAAAKITDMDQVLAWISLIPLDRYVLRRIVGARSMINPHTDRHIYPWRRIASAIGANHIAVQRWHGDGIALIVSGLHRRNFIFPS